MNREIKEILEYLKNDFYVYGETYIEEKCKIVTKKEKHQLLDYIKNLQTIEKEYSAILSENTELEQENKKLKELCDKYEEEHSTAFKLWTMKMKEMPDYEEKVNYKSRINKAIEYINNLKPLNEEETDIKEMLKKAYYDSNVKGTEEHFKTICHLEDYEIAIWNIKNILTGGE